MSSGVKTKSKSNGTILSRILYSVIAGILIFVILLAVSSLLILNIFIPSEYLYILILISSGISVITGAATGSFLAPAKRLFFGMAVTLTLTVIEFTLLLCFNNIEISSNIIIILPVAVIAGFIGSVTGVNIIKK